MAPAVEHALDVDAVAEAVIASPVVARVGEVAYLLGFSEPGNFTRSFKRRTGQPPQAFQSGG